MQVTIEDDPHVVLDQLGDELLDVEDAGVDCGHTVLVLPVEVPPGQVTPGVAHYYAVRIEHRDNLEDEQSPEALSGLCVSREVMKYS